MKVTRAGMWNQIFRSWGVFRPPKHTCVHGVKFIERYGTANFIATQDWSFWGLSDLWSDIWPAIDGVVYLSILLERETTDGFEQFHQTASEWL